MGKALAHIQEESKKKDKQKQRHDKPLSREEKHSLIKIQQGAKKAGTILKNGGKGGLPPSLVLAVMSRDKFTCKVHGDKGEGEYGGIEVHHKGGIVESKWLSQKGHANEPNNIVTICAKGHDEIHNKARKDGVDSGQVTPSGDKGDPRRDHGLPDAPVDRKGKGKDNGKG
jgi:hypothetical protein